MDNCCMYCIYCRCLGCLPFLSERLSYCCRRCNILDSSRSITKRCRRKLKWDWSFNTYLLSKTHKHKTDSLGYTYINAFRSIYRVRTYINILLCRQFLSCREIPYIHLLYIHTYIRSWLLCWRIHSCFGVESSGYK